ncbi:hypothetical protein [Natronospira bacteriovora]|uniref:Uncharacterized protein n=1 Tax=Natronospira bacteriovora TaxID=3069753 RepID=A0ABU0W8I7_9GAMM|nr:hypothetical protein [Natronospira sp. AB-CW4]MDQ2070338.1 hypothetical protein [Natronospira sp. AB-CW4]
MAIIALAFLAACFPRPAEETFHSHIRSGNYHEAYQMVDLDAVGREGQTYSFLATFDLVNIHVHGREVDKLHCRSVHDAHPNSYSYSVRLCAILIQYLDQGEVDQKRIDAMAEVIEDNYRRLRFLIDAAEDLNRRKP